MKFLRSFPAALLLALAAPAAFGQGALTPPGAPAPTMKTLDQVEARIPIPGGTAAFTATASGSYYLTGNLTVGGDAITINADNVTLDLNGYSVLSTAASSGQAITVASASGGAVAIRHGHVHGQTTFASGAFTAGGFTGGILVRTTGSVRVEDITVTGVRGDAINVDNLGGTYVSLIITHCAVNVAGGAGIYIIGSGSVDHCVASPCGSSAIFAQNASITDCYGYAATSGNGLEGLIITNSTGEGTNAHGIFAYGNVSNCNGSANVSGSGIYAAGPVANSQGYGLISGSGVTASTAVGCYAYASGTGNGLVADEATNCTGGVGGGGTGVKCTYSATGCHGSSNTGTGLSALTATGCSGQTSGTTNTAYGIDCTATGVAANCQAGAGNATAFSIRAKIANGCALGTGSTAAITHNVNSF